MKSLNEEFNLNRKTDKTKTLRSFVSAEMLSETLKNKKDT